MEQSTQHRLDVVYMWVDDRWPGYAETLARYARNAHDRNPNRTRNNLDTLKYSLRSLALFAPWRGRFFVVTCRPQSPAWLDRRHPDIRLVHHDEFMPDHMLPTFNSFAIQSWLHALPGLTQRFVCFDDDMLLMRPTTLADFLTPEGRPRYHFQGRLATARRSRDKTASPWNMALANGAALLNDIHDGPHPGFAHPPKLFDRGDCADIIARWPDAFARTWESRFRGHDNVACEALLPQYLVALGRAEAVAAELTRRDVAYVGLENYALWNRYLLWQARRRGAAFLTLNDNFGAHPRDGAVAVARRFLDRRFPDPSPYETAERPASC